MGGCSKYSFHFVSGPAWSDIRLGWREIDGKGGVLGQTTVPASGKLSNVIVALDVEEDWFLVMLPEIKSISHPL